VQVAPIPIEGEERGAVEILLSHEELAVALFERDHGAFSS